MRPYRFNLDTILRLRDSEEQAAQEVYARALAKRHDLEKGIARAFQRLAVLNDANTAAMMRPGLPAAQQGSYIRHYASQQTRIADMQRVLEELLGKERAALQAYLEAKRSADVLHKLKEKRRAQHMQEEERREEREIEDIYNARMRMEEISN